MSKAELVAAVQKSLGKEASSAQAERTVDAVIEGIKTGVKKTKSVQLVGFGTFKIATRKARTGVNPKTGEKIKIKSQQDGQIRTRKSIQRTLVIGVGRRRGFESKTPFARRHLRNSLSPPASTLEFVS